MGAVISLQGLGSFLIYFVSALVAQAVFVALYIAVTPYHEPTLIRRGNVAAAISLGGAVLGFTLPLASAVINSVSPVDMIVWSVVALVVQLAVFRLAELVLSGIGSHIEEGNVAAGLTMATAALAIGIINAASMSY
jgi:putative membrane protein